MKKLLLLSLSHGAVAFAGFAAGIYLLPVISASPAPSPARLAAVADAALYTTEFRRDLADSDFLHWGEGKVWISREAVAMVGSLAPGPSYKLYLSPALVETEAEFARLRGRMTALGDVRRFEDFVVGVPPGVDVDAYAALVVWCESFGEFITAASYR